MLSQCFILIRIEMVTLYKVTATNAIQIWTIFEEAKSILIEWGQLNGSMQSKRENISINQSGRNLDEQLALQVNSRVNKQLDKGYCYTIEEARQSVGLNASKLLKPMLAQQLKDSKVDFKKCFVQYKYNGHRCLIMGTEEGPIAYSRNGKQINTIKHITDSIGIQPGVILDGELYVHGMALQDAGSLIKKIQPGNDKLDYIIYDTIINNPYEQRLERIMEYEFVSESVKVAPTLFPGVKDIEENLRASIAAGYEGLILRTNDTGYEAGKRSKSLIKIKKWLDAEFLITNIIASKDGWAVLECQLPTGGYFRVSAPGNIDEKIEILINSCDYIGRIVNVEFFEYTNDGVPFHPVAKYFRT
jgi:ATP-dependent DNA ligase